MPLLSGQILQSRYRILSLLGQGGMGAVYLAEDLRLNRRCVVKENIPDPYADPQTLAALHAQFRMEADILAGLDHPNLPRVFDYFSEAGNDYLVMEWIEGQDLDTVLQNQGGPLPVATVLTRVGQVLDVLDYLHSQQPHPILHRDIKPANLIVTPQGQVKLVDFGLTKLFDPRLPRTVKIIAGRGTPEYAPPEQYGGGGGHTDTRADIYALGATLYHLLTNVAPPSVPERAQDPSLLAPPHHLNPAISAATASAIMRAMELQRDRRFSSSQEMRVALLSGQAGQALATTTVLPAPLPAPQRVWQALHGRLALGATLLAVMLALAWLAGRMAQATSVAITPTAFSPAVVAAAATDPPTATPTHIPSPTSTPRPAATPTPTRRPATASPTRRPTSTPTRRSSPTPIPAPLAQVQVNSANLRAGPGTAYAIVGQARRGEQFRVVGRNQDSTWWQIALPSGGAAWVATELVTASRAGAVPQVQAPPTPTRPPQATAAQPAAQASTAGQWVLVADSLADYPGPLADRRWWYLWSSGRNNFEWQDMQLSNPDACQQSPNSWGLTICRDRMLTNNYGDIALLWKYGQGGTYRFEWNSPALRFYRHLRFVGSQGRGVEFPFSATFRDVPQWELFFWVPSSSTSYHVKVYRLQE